MRGEFILVAGASGDIGRAIVVELAEAGAEVLMIGRDRQRLAGQEVAVHAPRVRFLTADLTDPAAVDVIRAEVAQKGRLDALVLSSGSYHRSADPAVLRQQAEANLIGPYALLQAVLEYVVESRGRVIFINSSQALRASAGVGQYAATKHAMKAIADSLREEVNERGVSVTSFYLGRTAGERQRSIFQMEGKPYHPELLIQPRDIARTVRHVLELPRTVEITDLTMRTAQKI